MIALVVVCSVLAALVPDQVDGFYSYYGRPRRYPVAVRDEEHFWKGYRLGKMEYGDRLLYESRISPPSDFDRSDCESSYSLMHRLVGKSSVNVDLPEYGQSPDGAIHFIEVFHLTTRRSGWTACITSGGLGHRYVSLRLDTDNKCEQEYLVRVYGC